LPARIVPQPGTVSKTAKGRVRQQLGDFGFRGDDLAVKLGQQPKIVG
jgi:hypothetical protein